MDDLEPPKATITADLSPSDDSYYLDSNCSTPFVSAPSSPGRAFDGRSGSGGGYFYSAPASPMHFVLSKASLRSSVPLPLEASETANSGSGSSDFEFSARFAATYDAFAAAEEIGSMSSADELFLNGQIRPLKLSTHLQRPQVLPPLADAAESDGNGDSSDEIGEVEEKDLSLRSRDSRLRNKSVRRRTRSLSPLRDTTAFDWTEQVVPGESDGGDRIGQRAQMMFKSHNNGDEIVSNETTPCASASSSRCSSAGRSSKRWLFLKEFLRSKSEGRSNHKFWTNISFSPAKDKKSATPQQPEPVSNPKKKKTSGGDPTQESQKPPRKSPANGVGKRRVPLSAHELHYTANRAQAEEMRKKTYLPYRQGLLGCLGFSSKSYGAMNGLARALNPVPSR